MKSRSSGTSTVGEASTVSSRTEGVASTVGVIMASSVPAVGSAASPHADRVNTAAIRSTGTVRRLDGMERLRGVVDVPPILSEPAGPVPAHRITDH